MIYRGCNPRRRAGADHVVPTARLMNHAAVRRFALWHTLLAGFARAAMAADCNDIAADPFGFSPAWRLVLGYETLGGGLADMDGNGLSDVVTIEPNRASLYLARAGGHFDRPVYAPA